MFYIDFSLFNACIDFKEQACKSHIKNLVQILVAFQDMKDFTPPPALCSGYGTLTQQDLTKKPLAVLEEREKKVKSWLRNLDATALKTYVDVCLSHERFKKLQMDLWSSVSPDRKFGDQPMMDVLQFDMWLKKSEISETIASRPVSPPVTMTTPSSCEVEPPANPEAYKEYWSKRKRQNAGALGSTPSRESLASAATPSPAPAAASTPSPASTGLSAGITPDCKTKLSLGKEVETCVSQLFFEKPSQTGLKYLEEYTHCDSFMLTVWCPR